MMSLVKPEHKPEFYRAHKYHQHAHAQKDIAQKFYAYLSQKQALNAINNSTNIIELGCGTGFFSHILHKQLPHIALTLLDNCQNMLDNCRNNLNTNNNIINYMLCDAEYTKIKNTSYTLPIILSNMCMQWFKSIPKYIENNIQQCEYMAFTIPTEYSFKNWQEMHAELNIVCPLHQLIPIKHIENYPYILDIEYINIPMHFKHVLDFMQHFKKIGAYIKHNPHYPSYQVRDIRHLIRYYNENNHNNKNFETSYHIAMVTCKY